MDIKTHTMTQSMTEVGTIPLGRDKITNGLIHFNARLAREQDFFPQFIGGKDNLVDFLLPRSRFPMTTVRVISLQ